MKKVLKLALLPGRFAIARLAPTAEVPAWAWKGSFVCVTRTPEELSILCEEQHAPVHVHAERGRRLLRVQGKLAFSISGILAALCDPLAAAGIAIFVVSTFDTDYLLVSDQHLDSAIEALEKAGHSIHRSNPE
ncbi:MAG: ACT domain-containing protein [Acidobacteriia bacterium]|nr:ACT domain-containing protein [Terriglobia bacterium]